MSNQVIVGSGVRVEIGLTESAPKTVLGITKASPGVVYVPAHGLAAESAGYFLDVVGMDEIEGQAAKVGAGGSPTLDNFSIEDVDTTDYSDFVSGTFVPIATWSTLSQSTQYQIGGGAAKTEDVSCLIDTTEKLLSVKNAAETVTIDIRSLKADNAAMTKIRSVARALGYLVFRITFPETGEQRLFRGQPSLPGESVAQGATGTGQLSVTVAGHVCYLA
jgi:hypothetical protein